MKRFLFAALVGLGLALGSGLVSGATVLAAGPRFF